jgi:hypothetical protein
MYSENQPSSRSPVHCRIVYLRQPLIGYRDSQVSRVSTHRLATTPGLFFDGLVEKRDPAPTNIVYVSLFLSGSESQRSVRVLSRLAATVDESANACVVRHQ